MGGVLPRPSLLLRGRQLARFETWADEAGLAQTELEREFLRASLDEREAVLAEEESRRLRQAPLERRAVNRLRALVAVLAVAAVVAAGLTVYAFDQSGRSRRQTQIATARQLAAASVANLDVDPVLSILLAQRAVEATRVNDAPLPDAVEALHRALAASRVVVTIETPATSVIAVSPDGSRVASAGRIGSARVRDWQAGAPGAARKAFVWDTRTGKLLLSLAGAKSPIHDIAYSPDGSRIVTGSDDGAAIVWDAGSGKRMVALRDPGRQGEPWASVSTRTGPCSQRPTSWAVSGSGSSAAGASFARSGSTRHCAESDGARTGRSSARPSAGRTTSRRRRSPECGTLAPADSSSGPTGWLQSQCCDSPPMVDTS